MLTLTLCLSLAGCSGSGPIDIVKNGYPEGYPDQPITEAFDEAFEKMGAEVEETWEDISDGELADNLAALGEDYAMVRCIYTAEYEGEEQTLIVAYLVNTSDESFIIFSIVNDGTTISDSGDINEFLNDYIF